LSLDAWIFKDLRFLVKCLMEIREGHEKGEIFGEKKPKHVLIRGMSEHEKGLSKHVFLSVLKLSVL
jgi:hypothetical protein